MLKQVKNVFLVSSSALIISACGGGGSSNTSSPPTAVTPPVQTNAAPTVIITPSNTSPNEGLQSTLDASTSSDAEGDSLTFSWTQLSGPDAVISAPTASITDISVPNVTGDTPARFQLQVSDGTSTTSSEVTLNFTNLVQTPVADFTITRESTLDYPNKVVAVPTDFFFNETLNFLVHETEGQFVWDSFGYDAANDLEIFQEQRATSDSANIVSSLDIFRPFDPGFAALGPDSVTFLDPIFDPSDRFSIDAEQPCSLVTGHQVSPSFAPASMIIGLRNGGAMLVDLELDSQTIATGDSTVLQNFGGDASLCALEISTTRLLAFDQNTNRVINYRITQDSNRNITDLSELSSVALDLNLPEGSDVEFVGSVGNLATASIAMALVFSDGETEGNHRLVVVGFAGEFFQDTYSWDYGAPTSIYRDAFERDAIDTFIIATKDSPQAVVFKSGNLSDLEPYLPLSGPSYLDLGVGHDIISNFIGPGPVSQDGIIVTFPDQNLVKVLEHP